MIDWSTYLGGVSRSVAADAKDGRPVRNVTLERIYDTTIEDLWDAVTNPERLPRWFAPVSGDLKLGGRYQVERNAAGTITECRPRRFVAATWEFGGETSWIELRLQDVDRRCRLLLTHICPVNDHWETYGAGATGLGWDFGLVGLAAHVATSNAVRAEGEIFMASAEGKAYLGDCSEKWRQAAVTGGEQTDKAAAAAKRTTAFYTGGEAA